MTKTSQTSDSLYSKDSFSNDFTEVDHWLVSFKNEKASSSSSLLSSTSNHNSKLNAEIHLAITVDPWEYISSLCERLFTLYRNAQHRPFVLQFLPSFVTTYYDVLHHHPDSDDVTTKDIGSTIDTFLVALYNLSVLDDGHNEKVHEFRIPNLTLPSIYHTPNPDYYAPTPLTQHAISKHEKKCEVVHLQSFAPFDSVNATTREQILWLLLIQYGAHVSQMDTVSRQAYFKMAKKLLGQGFSFNENISVSEKSSPLPPTGRRIHVSSRLLSEVLGTLFYFKANSSDKEASECMYLLKKRAEYEMYSDVILMTESICYLHEFESHHLPQQDTIGIEIELPPTIDMVKQKRTATTTRSIKNRQRSHKHQKNYEHEMVVIENDLPNEAIERLVFVPVPSDATPTALESPYSDQNKSINDKKCSTIESINSPKRNISSSNEQLNASKIYDDTQDVTTPLISETKTDMSSPIGGLTSSASPSSTRNYKPKSLASTQTYFKTLQQQQLLSSPKLQNVTTRIHNHDNENDDDDGDDDDNDGSGTPQSHRSSLRHGEKKDLITSVRFAGTNSNGTTLRETFL